MVRLARVEMNNIHAKINKVIWIIVLPDKISQLYRSFRDMGEGTELT